jgi:hypothetical protein
MQLHVEHYACIHMRELTIVACSLIPHEDLYRPYKGFSLKIVVYYKAKLYCSKSETNLIAWL